MANQTQATTQAQATTMQHGGSSNAVKLALAWLAVGVPLLWGVIQTLRRAMALFG